ncbi:MAG: type II toxin-antitoxin system ParD family antitoxin, partial [Phycisphaerales bacterium JB063]
INVNMPDELRKFVDEQVALKGFATPTEYVRQLIRDERKRAAQDRLEQLLLDGLNSGPPIPLDDAEWGRMKQEARRQIEARKSGGH